MTDDITGFTIMISNVQGYLHATYDGMDQERKNLI